MPDELRLTPRPITSATSNTTGTTASPPSTQSPPLDLRLPPSSVRFNDEFAVTPRLPTGGRYDREVRAAMDSFTQEARLALVHPEGEQQALMRSAAEHLVRNLPVGAVLPGLELPGVSGDTPLGRVPNRTAESLVNQLRESNPTAFYALAAGIGGAVGYAAYQNGGRGPNLVNLNLMNGALRLQVAPEFGPHFSDVRANAQLTGHVEFDNGATGNVRLDSQGRWSAEYTWLPRDRNVSLYARVGSGQPDFAGNGRSRDDGWHAWVGVRASW